MQEWQGKWVFDTKGKGIKPTYKIGCTLETFPPKA